MHKPKVAIIIPCLNAHVTIGACLESALGQSYEQLQVHVQDGGSQDGTLQQLKSIASPRFSYQVATDTGVYDAINKALHQLDADWYYILGSDDKITGLDAVASVMAFAPTGCPLLYGDVRYGRRSNKLIPQLHHSRFDTSLWWKNSLHQQGTFYHRSILPSHGFDSRYKILADYDFHLQLLRIGVKAKHTGMTLCECSATGLSKQFKWSLYREELRIKRRRLALGIYLINIPWVISKWLAKKFG